jgi:low affinity Fe/Cu permease
MGSWFTRFAKATAHTSGRPVTFLVALGVIIVWAATGPMFHYSNTWQLIINTGTTIVTFLMVFLIQNTQNRDSQAIHVKLDELIRALHGARNSLIDLDELTDEELDRLHETYVDLAKHAEHKRHGRSQKDGDTTLPEKPKTANAKNSQKVAVKNGTSKS